MQRASTIIESLHFVSIVCVFNQAIYSKACEIKWKEPRIFRNCLLMMGIFNLQSNYLEILKKQFHDARMKDALLQSATANGKSHRRWVRQYKIFHEALVRLVITDVLQEVEDCCIEGLTGWIYKWNIRWNKEW